MTPRRLLMIKGDYDRAGGPETLLSGILQTLDRTRHQPSLVVLRKTENNGAEVLSSTDDRIEIPWRGLRHVRDVSKKLIKLIDSSKVDLVHTHDMRSNLAIYMMGRKRLVPWIAHVHGWLGKTHRGKFRIYEKIDQFIIRRADLVVVGSTATAKEAKSCGARKVEVVPNSIMIAPDCSDAATQNELRKSLNIQPDQAIIGVLGRVHPGKGQTVLINAFHQISTKNPHIHLLVVGDGPDLHPAKALASSLGLANRITFTGFHDDALSLLPLMEVVVVPSLKESLPLTALEAMSRGRCVIASRTGDLPRVILDRQCGCLVDPGDVNQLAGALQNVLDNPELRAQYGSAARQRIKDHYSMESMSRRLESIYDSLTEGRARHA